MNLWANHRKHQKAEFKRRQLNYLLDQGKTVINVTPGNMERMKRVKHLTLIEEFKPKGGTFQTIGLDEWSHNND